MKKALALMLTTAMFFAVGCGKDDDPNNGGNNGGGSNPTTEGIYLGVIGFNYDLVAKDLGLLNSSTKSSFTTFISNMTMDNLTGLYYADYTALKKLQSYGEPPKLKNVALVTFTDGLDNASLDDDKNPENYPTREAYLNALNNKIKTEKVHGQSINAYTIGLKGNDVQDVAAFQNNLKKLASSDDNVFEVTSMDEAIQRFSEIAESLHSTSVSNSLSLLVPPGYDDGLVLRFTFDQVSTATNSTLFLECTYKRADNGRRLENISYHGFKQGVASLSSVEKLSNGFYKFVFENLEKENGGFVTQSDKKHLKLYRQISSGWEPETEFDNNNQSTVTKEQSSALIMLVLDCTTSLGSQFSSLKTGAARFVETLVSSNGGGNNGGGGNGVGGGPQYYTVSVVASEGGSVSGGGTYEAEQQCLVSAIANPGYAFSEWMENGSAVCYAANWRFTVNTDRMLVANFIAQSLNLRDFEWQRQGGQPATGLEEFGLKYDHNGRWFAVIEPLEGAELYQFAPSVWEMVNTSDEKIAIFNNAQNITEFCQISTLASSYDQNYVIGTKYNGDYHLIHITRSEIGFDRVLCVTIRGQAK